MNDKIVVLDIDGTLYSEKREILPKTRQILFEFQKKGGRIFLASGRNLNSLKEIAEDLCLNEDSILVGVNGQHIHYLKDQSTFKYRLMNEDEVKSVFEACHKYNVEAFFANGNRILHYLAPGVDTYLYDGYEGTIIIDKVVKSYDDLKGLDINKIILVSLDEVEMAANLKKISAELDSSLQIMQLAPTWSEIMAGGVNKAVALQKVIDDNNLDINKMYAFGDSENDAEMLKMFPNSYAMGNANERIKGLASNVTLSNDDEGIYEIVKNLI